VSNKPAALLKYCLAAPVLSRLSLETQEMLGIEQSTENEDRHHQDHDARIIQQEKNVEALKTVLEPVHVFSDTSEHLHTFITKKVLRKEAETSILNMEGRER